MSFETLGLNAALIRSVTDAGYTEATEVQAQAIPPALQGRDMMVSSRTGSGKTASFVLPALQRVLDARNDPTQKRERGVSYGPRILVLTPTRELALQIEKAALTYGRHVQGLRVATVVGGVPYPAQLKALRGPLDLLIATPGRLLDHLQSGKAVLQNVQMFVLDEADRMLDMGFIDDIRLIADQLPAQRQTLMYSATFAGSVGALANTLLRDPQRIEVASHTESHENIEQRLHWADNAQHKNALLDHILTEATVDQALVFTSTQRDADWLADRLADMGHAVASLHGGMPQGRRNRVLQGLRTRHLRVLVATDVAARGIDVPTISHVINYGLPMKAEDYVHRIGRTGRAGRNGLAVTLAERMDAGMIRRIQHFTTQRIPVETVTGLEPRQPEPRLHPMRPEGSNDSFGRGARPSRPGQGPRKGGKPFGAPAGRYARPAR
jgi:superfamily II DNA/RNA helicase